MLEAYEAIAETRPRIRRDVLFTETPDGVLFHNAHGGFHLNSRSGYRFATLIVPHLNGENRVADLCEGLGEPQRAMVGRLVRTLYEREFARDTPVPDGPSVSGPAPEVAERFAPQIAYVDHYTDDAARRFQEFRTTRVAVVGDDLIARWCVLSLVRNGSAAVGHLPGLDTPENRFAEVRAEAGALAAEGCPVALETIATDGPVRWSDLTGYDVVVVTGGREGSRRLFRLVAAGVPEGTSLIPAALFGDRAVVGPLMTPGTAGCWACAVLRLGAHGDAAAAADLWSGICLPAGDGPPAREAGRGLSAMIGNLLGYEVFRLTTGALPAETRGQVIVQDTESFDVVAEPLLPHPRCPFCPSPEATGTPARPVAPEEPAPAGGTPPGLDTEALLAELNGRQILLRPHTGVFERFTDEPWTQTPLKVGAVSLPTGHAGRRNITAFDIHTVAGARLTALNAAAGAYTEHVVPLRGVLTGEALDDARRDTRSLAPAALTVASGLAADAPEPAAWVRATSLADGEPVLVPAGAVRTFGPYNRDRLHTPTTAGTGAGRTAAEATARGLLSALCHDALERAVRGTGGAALVAPEGLGDDPELAFLLSSARNLGVECELLDLGEPARSSAHVLLARALLPRTGERIWAVAGETGRRRAAAGALRDLLGQEQLGRELAERGEPPVDLGDPLLGDLEPAALAVTGTSGARLDEATSYPAILDRLRAAGREALVVPTDSADLLAGGISTVRVFLTREGARTTGASRAH